MRFLRHNACSFFGEALTFLLLKELWLEPRLNRNVFRGFRFSGLRVIPPTGKSKAPAAILLFFLLAARLIVCCC
ncbi:hypothetical protein EA593_19110 [Salmonella enterica subsp. enterica serovar Give]|nr:hypothetical protein [Salmonella enterica subsp. enterica serovar Give]EAN3288574.1 hypothetical protein [Salmonella enterica subsp. enterica serovar Give]EAN3324673.1 hypothetical protein [Salmonella enterica subsp. enterica serovar Give]EED4372875.1 hypothetical protein [Salmonella enterica subsp. enterica serovar Give]EEJ1916676.1 hypothetical protein [Salmonella enterica subsp. enterica serovar Urbana]